LRFSADPVKFSERAWSTPNVLIAPVFDIDKNIVNVQLINVSSYKRFLVGGRVDGRFFPLGVFTAPGTILIAEGVATCASLHEATGLPSVATFSPGLLLQGAKVLKCKFPDARLILCADDDDNGSGVAKRRRRGCHSELRCTP
jgi:putative DNA primase/helicase